MKKLVLLSAMGLLIGLSQCTKPEVQEIAGGQTLTQTITLTADLGDGSKVSFTEPDPATGQLNLAWEPGDHIKVYEGLSTTAVGDLTRVSGNTFTGDITATVGSTLTFRYGSTTALAELNAVPAYTSQKGTLDWLKSNCCLQGTATCVASGSYNVTMGLTYAILKLDLSALGTAGGETVTISAGGSQIASVSDVTTSSKTMYVAMPADNTSTDYTFTGNGKSFYRTWEIMANSFYTADNGSGFGTGAAIVVGPLYLPGDFTVGETSKGAVKVKFSRGNLYWNGSAFKIEANQWDFQPTSDGTWSSDHVSHFFWQPYSRI